LNTDSFRKNLYQRNNKITVSDMKICFVTQVRISKPQTAKMLAMSGIGILSLLGLAIKPAHAGKWVASYYVTGTAGSASSGWYGSGPFSNEGAISFVKEPTGGEEDEENEDENGPGFYAYNESHATEGESSQSPAASTNIHAKVKVVLRWIPDAEYGAGGDPPPETIGVKITSSAKARAWAWGTGHTRTIEVAADNGFGSPDSAITDPESFLSQGVRYLKMDSSSGVVEIEGLEVNASGSVHDGLPEEDVITDVEVSLFAEEAYRYAVISSDIDQSYCKSTKAPPTKPGMLPLPSIPGSDPPVWRIPVGKVAARHSAMRYDALSSAWKGSVVVSANVMGFTEPHYAWSVGGVARHLL
jgi:hypothetical protein